MTAEVLLFSRSMRILRSPQAEDVRRDRLRWIRRAAYNRAVHGGYNKADEAMFGPSWRLMHDGPTWREPAAGDQVGPTAA